eukprot:3967679-Amphidinium_carterae.2
MTELSGSQGNYYLELSLRALVVVFTASLFLRPVLAKPDFYMCKFFAMLLPCKTRARIVQQRIDINPIALLHVWERVRLSKGRDLFV